MSKKLSGRFGSGFGVEDFGCKGEVDGFACMPNKLRTSGRSVRPAGVLKCLVL